MNSKNIFISVKKDVISNNNINVNSNIVPNLSITKNIKTIGSIIYDTTINRFLGFTNTGWETISIGENIAQVLSNGPNPGDAGGQILFNLGTLAFENNKISIGQLAGETNQQNNTIAIGYGAGRDDQQSDGIAIGFLAAAKNQQNYSIAIGTSAGYYNPPNQEAFSISIGPFTGNQQGINGISIGTYNNNLEQKDNSITIGYSNLNNLPTPPENQENNAICIGNNNANTYGQGTNAIIIGNYNHFLYSPKQPDNSIILGGGTNALQINTLYISSSFIKAKAVTDTAIEKELYYNTLTNELFYKL